MVSIISVSRRRGRRGGPEITRVGTSADLGLPSLLLLVVARPRCQLRIECGTQQQASVRRAWVGEWRGYNKWCRRRPCWMQRLPRPSPKRAPRISVCTPVSSTLCLSSSIRRPARMLVVQPTIRAYLRARSGACMRGAVRGGGLKPYSHVKAASSRQDIGCRLWAQSWNRRKTGRIDRRRNEGREWREDAGVGSCMRSCVLRRPGALRVGRGREGWAAGGRRRMQAG